MEVRVPPKDISESPQELAALRQSEERFRLIANAAPVMIWVADATGRVTDLNDTYLEFTGLALPAALGNGWMTVLHPDEVERCLDLYAKASERRERFRWEQRLRRHDGEYRWVVSTGVPRYERDGSFAGYVGTATDVTDQKLAKDALATISQKVTEAHKAESARIARELHDDICQRLVVVSLRLDGLQHRLPASAADVTPEIVAVGKEIASLASDIQALSHRLHTSKLDVLGLEAAAAGLCEEVSRRHDVQIDVRVEKLPTALPADISLCLYRVLQEALQNVVKHSGARRAHVSIAGGVDTIDLTVGDVGVGFYPDDAMRGIGLGLTTMRERVALVGGQLSVHSEPGRGTTIRALVPLRLADMRSSR